MKTDAASGKQHTQDNSQPVHRNCGKTVGVVILTSALLPHWTKQIQRAIIEAPGSMRSAESAPANTRPVRSLQCGHKIFLYE